MYAVDAQLHAAKFVRGYDAVPARPEKVMS